MGKSLSSSSNLYFKHSQDTSPLFQASDHEEEREYEVEAIVAQKKRKGKTFYKVHWKGFGPEDDTWEPSEALVNAQECLKEFLAKQDQRNRMSDSAHSEIETSEIEPSQDVMETSSPNHSSDKP